MSHTRSYVYVCETAAEIDRDEGRDIGDSKAVARDELMSVQFVIHSFQALINDRSLRLEEVRRTKTACVTDHTSKPRIRVSLIC